MTFYDCSVCGLPAIQYGLRMRFQFGLPVRSRLLECVVGHTSELIEPVRVSYDFEPPSEPTS